MSWHKITLKVIDVLALLGYRCYGTHQVTLKGFKLMTAAIFLREEYMPKYILA